MKKDWPVRPAARLFYAREKAELEQLLQRRGRAESDEPALYLLRPPIVLGPDAMGAKDALPGPWRRRAARARPPRTAARTGARCSTRTPAAVHRRGGCRPRAVKCGTRRGTTGAYKIAGDGVLTGADVVARTRAGSALDSGAFSPHGGPRRHLPPAPTVATAGHGMGRGDRATRDHGRPRRGRSSGWAGATAPSRRDVTRCGGPRKDWRRPTPARTRRNRKTDCSPETTSAKQPERGAVVVR